MATKIAAAQIIFTERSLFIRHVAGSCCGNLNRLKVNLTELLLNCCWIVAVSIGAENKALN